jgi:hypothetical protein
MPKKKASAQVRVETVVSYRLSAISQRQSLSLKDPEESLIVFDLPIADNPSCQKKRKEKCH